MLSWHELSSRTEFFHWYLPLLLPLASVVYRRLVRRWMLSFFLYFYLRARFYHFFPHTAPKYREFEFMCTNLHSAHDKIELQPADRITAKKKMVRTRSKNVSILVDFVLISSIQFRVTGKFEIFTPLACHSPLVSQREKLLLFALFFADEQQKAMKICCYVFFFVSLFCSSS